MVSRSENNLNYYKQRLEGKGIEKVKATSADKDGLNSIIHKMRPDLMIMSARFYQCSTPYMMGLLKKEFPWVRMAALCFDDYPPDLGMYFIVNGVSYFNMFEGIDQFNLGIKTILEGREFVSEEAMNRLKMRKDLPLAARKLPQKHIEIIRCICNGFTNFEIADNLALSVRTVANYRELIYLNLNVNDGVDLLRAALTLHIVTEDELVFCHRSHTLKPLPIQSKKNKKEKIDMRRIV